jgi:WD40 repeat protein
MKVEEALRVIDTALSPAALNDIQEQVLRGVWEGQTYDKIAEQTNYESEYIKHVGYQLWQKLSQALGERIAKGNLQSVLRRKALQFQETNSQTNDLWIGAGIEPARPGNLVSNITGNLNSLVRDNGDVYPGMIPQRQDWGEAINVTAFYGRTEEVLLLQKWVLVDRCRLISLLGMGGIGKTSLTQKFVRQIQDQFDCLIWRSLRQAPPLDEILTAILKFISPEIELHLPESEEGKLARLIEALQTKRCLIILDNLESVLWGGDVDDTSRQRAGHYRRGYEGYGELLKYVGESSHQSCLVLTSREKPKEIASLESQATSVRSLIVKGLSAGAAHQILQNKQINDSSDNCDQLVQRYAGNPLALKIVSTTIQELFAGNVGEFLQEGIAFFGDIGELLDEQFNRLSSLEKQVMFWLAVSQEPISLAELSQDIASVISKRELLEALESLSRRPLIEKIGNRFTQQPLVMEYMTERIVEEAFQELVTKEISLLESHALLKATAKDYIREGQTRLILCPIIEKLKAHFKSLKLTEIQLKQVLNLLQAGENTSLGYGAGNLINLLCQLKGNLQGYDFSHLTVRHAYLRNIDLHQVNFAHANLDSAVFTETFGGILSFTLSSNGIFLTTGSTDSTVRLWRIADGKQLWIGKGHLAWVWSVAFSPDYRHVASGSGDGTIRIWEVETGECVRVLRLDNPFEILSITFSPDGETLLVGGNRKDVFLLDIKTGNCLQTFLGQTDKRIRSVAFSPNGQTIGIAGTDAQIQLCDAATGQCLQTFTGHSGWVRSIAFSPDGQLIASGSSDHTIKLWDIHSGDCLETFKSHTGAVSGVAFSADGSMLASSSVDCTLKLWYVSSGQCLQTLQGHINLLWAVAFCADGETVVSGGDDHSVRFWDIPTGRCIKTWQGHANAFFAVHYPPPNPSVPGKTSTHEYLLASGSEDQIIRLWQRDTRTSSKMLMGHKGRVMSLAYSSDGQTLFSGGTDSAGKLWDVQTGQCLETFYGHTSWIWAVAYSPDGQHLATASEDTSVRLWGIDGQCLRTLEGHQGTVFTVAFSPDAKTLVSGGVDCTIRVWKINHADAPESQILCEHTSSILALTFTPDGRSLIASSKGPGIKIWNPVNGKCLKTLEGHVGAVWAIAVSPDGKTLASGGEDGTLKIWDLASGNCLQTLPGHKHMIKSVTFHPQNAIVVSGSLDQTMKVWDLDTGNCLETLRVERPYEDMNITGVSGLTDAQRATLKALGAIEVNN